VAFGPLGVACHPSFFSPDMASLNKTQLVEGSQPEPLMMACSKCGTSTNPGESGSRVKSNELTCSNCTSVYQMLYRHLGGTPEGIVKMDAASQKAFFKEAGSVIQTAPRNGRWSLVKSSLVKSITHYRTTQIRTRVTEEFLPLSVWAQRGFDAKLVETKGQKGENEARLRLFFLGVLKWEVLFFFPLKVWLAKFLGCRSLVMSTLLL